ncbi:MAG: hypothetical protein ACRYHQ_30535 [Janthinobacterium lividum]
MRNPMAYAAFLIPKLLVVYISVAVVGALVFFLVSALYVYPASSLIAYASLIIGLAARKSVPKYIERIHPIRAMNSLILP